MKTALLVCCLLIGILSAHGVDKKEDKSKVTPEVDITKTKASESKDKRQIGSSDTASYSNEKHDDPEQPQETIYGPKRNQFLIRPLSPHDQQLRNYQPTSRPHSQQLQALGPQLEQSQEIQHYAYLQDTSRNQQGKAIAEGKSHALVKKPSTVQLQQYAEEQYAQQQLQSQAHAAQVQFTPAHGQFRPSAYIPAQPQQEQQPQEVAQYQALQEEHLLKLIEEELRARALQEAQSRASYPQGSQQIRPSERQGLVHYRSKFEEGPDFPSYAPRAGPHHQGPQYLPQQQQQQQQQHIRIQTQQPTQSAPVNFYHGPSAVSYRTLPNHPLAEASLEKELEKLMASNRPLTFRHSSPSALHTGRSPFLQPKSYSTTASPSTTVGQASQYYSPSIVQYSGFQPSPTAPTINQEHQQHKKYAPPSAYSTSQPQYLIESSPAPSKSSKSSSSSSSGGQYRVKLHTSKSKSSQAKQNVGPVQFYYGEQQQQQEQPQHSQQQAPTQQQQQQEYQQYAPLVTSAAPSQSSIFVSQSTGLQPSQKTKVQGASKQLELPPPDGKPITQAEFQALVDAGYPVQAVPVPVPVPYDQYIKDHPEYQGEPVEIPQQRHSQRSAVSEDSEVRYLRPSSSERHYQQSRRPRDQKEEVAPGKNESS